MVDVSRPCVEHWCVGPGGPLDHWCESARQTTIGRELVRAPIRKQTLIIIFFLFYFLQIFLNIYHAKPCSCSLKKRNYLLSRFIANFARSPIFHSQKFFPFSFLELLLHFAFLVHTYCSCHYYHHRWSSTQSGWRYIPASHPVQLLGLSVPNWSKPFSTDLFFLFFIGHFFFSFLKNPIILICI